jgi:hypothetical protein
VIGVSDNCGSFGLSLAGLTVLECDMHMPASGVSMPSVKNAFLKNCSE